jgi:hypothetical protein
LIRDNETALTAHPHSFEAGIPTGNDIAPALMEAEWRPWLSIARRVT